MSQIGMYYGNRWGRSPRPDEMIDKSLKGLGRDYTIYHYVTSAAHLLVGPAGIWTMMPYYQSGKIIYEKKRWKSRGGGFLQSYLRLFGQENMGRPEIESETEIEATKRYLAKNTAGGKRNSTNPHIIAFYQSQGRLASCRCTPSSIDTQRLERFYARKR